MTVLSDTDIKKRIEDGGIKISPFIEDKLQPASYDLVLGDIIKAGASKADSSQVAIEPNNWALVSSKEIVSLPNDICATYGIVSSIARQGILHFGGPQIDPGYDEGKIFAAIYNPTLETIVLNRDEDFFTIMFHEVSSLTKGYQGQHQGMRDFPSADVQRMMNMKTKDLLHVIESVDKLHDGLNALKDDVHAIREVVSNFSFLSKYKWLFKVGGVILLFVLAATATVLVEMFVSSIWTKYF